MQLKFNITGINKIDKRLKTMERKVVRKIIRKAARSGSMIIKKYLKSTLPKDEGNFRKALSVKGYKSRKLIGYYVHIAAEKLPNPKEFYPAYLEHGSPKTGLTARKYFYNAYVQLKDEINKKVISEIIRGVNEQD